jgi:hypothetical protein
VLNALPTLALCTLSVRSWPTTAGGMQFGKVR